MGKAKNKVIAGDYKGKDIQVSRGKVKLSVGFARSILVDSSTVESYELLTDEHRKSAVSGAVRGLIGNALIGGAGLLAGGISGKSKGIYQVALQFRDGTRSLVEVDDQIYKAIIRNCF